MTTKWWQKKKAKKTKMNVPLVSRPTHPLWDIHRIFPKKKNSFFNMESCIKIEDRVTIFPQQVFSRGG